MFFAREQGRILATVGPLHDLIEQSADRQTKQSNSAFLTSLAPHCWDRLAEELVEGLFTHQNGLTGFEDGVRQLCGGKPILPDTVVRLDVELQNFEHSQLCSEPYQTLFSKSEDNATDSSSLSCFAAAFMRRYRAKRSQFQQDPALEFFSGIHCKLYAQSLKDCVLDPLQAGSRVQVAKQTAARAIVAFRDNRSDSNAALAASAAVDLQDAESKSTQLISTLLASDGFKSYAIYPEFYLYFIQAIHSRSENSAMLYEIDDKAVTVRSSLTALFQDYPRQKGWFNNYANENTELEYLKLT